MPGEETPSAGPQPSRTSAGNTCQHPHGISTQANRRAGSRSDSVGGYGEKLEEGTEGKMVQEQVTLPHQE